jgi:tripartite-type tricarboxylate transporter receptor subunit TctC
MTSAGIDAAGGAPEAFRDALRADVERWRKVVKAAGIKTSD